MINLVTVKVGTKYTAADANRIHTSFKTDLPITHFCITDDPTGLHPWIEALPPPIKVPGWWNKIALFNYSYHYPRCVYLDLDLVILDSVDDLIQQPGFCAGEDHYHWHGVRFGSAFMAWDAGRHRNLFNDFAADPWRYINTCPAGDQQYIGSKVNADTYLDGIASYKKDIEPTNTIPAGTRIINFHGDPKPTAILADTTHPFYPQLKVIRDAQKEKANGHG